MYLKRYLVSGVITVIPMWVTWVVFNFVFSQLNYNYSNPKQASGERAASLDLPVDRDLK